jgi:hypothetical protein
MADPTPECLDLAIIAGAFVPLSAQHVISGTAQFVLCSDPEEALPALRPFPHESG